MQLLGEILLHRANVKAMMRYVSEVDNLKLMMVLLKDQSRSIQFEAFHVFKARSHCVSFQKLALHVFISLLKGCTHSRDDGLRCLDYRRTSSPSQYVYTFRCL